MTNDLQNGILEVGKQFVAICDKYGLKYYMLGGTLLGAVRHGGFIPWDEDMDFGMPRKDYEQLFKILKKNKENNIKLIHPLLNNLHDYPIRLENTAIRIIDNTTAIPKEKYAWIDILPLDGMPSYKIFRKIHGLHLLYLRALYKMSQLSVNVAEINPDRTKTEKLIISISKFLKIEKILNEKKRFYKLDKSLKKYTFENSSYVIDFMGAYKLKEMFPKKIYSEFNKYQFEDTLFIGPKDYQSVLTQLYGDYRKIPDLDKRKKHNLQVITK